jgi:hypothetical protein
MAEVRFRYPNGTPPEQHYDPGVERTGRKFMPILFQPHRLHEVTSPGFVEHHSDGQVTLVGLQALLDYRAQFGGPTLLKADMLAVPRQLIPVIDAPDNPRFNFSTVTEFTFLLPEGAPQFPTKVRMWESLDVRPPISVVGGHERTLVHGRTYRPLGATGLLTETNQHDFVQDQVEYFLENGEPMPMAPIEEAAQAVIPGATFADTPFEAGP